MSSTNQESIHIQWIQLFKTRNDVSGVGKKKKKKKGGNKKSGKVQGDRVGHRTFQATEVMTLG